MKNTYLQKLYMAPGLLLLASVCTSEPAGDGSKTGGSTGSGGFTHSGGTMGSGGATATGGSSASGGATANGGSAASGGVTASGGTSSAGGSVASGGTTSSGGVTTTGGFSSTGGASGSGGTTGTGGTSHTGGSRAAGGTTGTGGVAGSGGLTRTDGGVGTGGITATGGANGGATGAGGSTHRGTWQIMPLGDSITGTTCYPKLLSKELIDKGHTNFKLVGTVLNNQDCGTGVANVQTEGHGGYLVTYLTSDSQASQQKGSLTELTTWAAEKPDVVLIEYGTNDVWSSVAPATITSAYGFVVDQFRSQNSTVIFFVAQITPMNPSDGSCTACESRVEALNAQIPGWASGKSTSASPIYVVNVWSAFPASSLSSNTKDGVHPNTAGAQLMADVWYAGIVAQGLP